MVQDVCAIHIYRWSSSDIFVRTIAFILNTLDILFILMQARHIEEIITLANPESVCIHKSSFIQPYLDR